jgi:hypothetical protein
VTNHRPTDGANLLGEVVTSVLWVMTLWFGLFKFFSHFSKVKMMAVGFADLLVTFDIIHPVLLER